VTAVAGRHGRTPTDRGERRRTALVDAAAALLEEAGFAAVSHRAVADRAGVPLAATTYYFASRDELVTAAAERMAAHHLDHAAAVLARLPTAPQPSDVVAGRILSLIAGADDPDPARLLTSYERYAQAGRVPALRPLVTALTDALAERTAVVLRHYGYPAAGPVPRLLVALVDGLLLAELVDAGATAVPRTRGALAEVLTAAQAWRPDAASPPRG
jgi:DNA-binding transcriptional regulator YbjK